VNILFEAGLLYLVYNEELDTPNDTNAATAVSYIAHVLGIAGGIGLIS
jgi:hypothetical protein